MLMKKEEAIRKGDMRLEMETKKKEIPYFIMVQTEALGEIHHVKPNPVPNAFKRRQNVEYILPLGITWVGGFHQLGFLLWNLSFCFQRLPKRAKRVFFKKMSDTFCQSVFQNDQFPKLGFTPLLNGSQERLKPTEERSPL